MSFLLWLRESRNLQTNTILNYKAALAVPLRIVCNLDLDSWEFKELKKSFFLERPPNLPSVPSWDISKVLTLLQSSAYSSFPPDKFNQLKKCLFLTALAAGNRVSEIAAMVRTGLELVHTFNKISIAVRPGFLYKNQRLGRAPNNIVIVPLDQGPPALCPVRSLASYLSLSSPKRGALFCNTKTEKPLTRASISKLLCSIIEEADPNKFPKSHDIRKVAASIAWTRGLNPEEITKRVFWRSSSVFIDRYLSSKKCHVGVALNTC